MRLLTNLFRWLRVLGNLLLTHTSTITWDKTVAASGGGINIGVDGITSVTDAGAAGRVPLAYDPTNNRIGVGIAAPTYSVHIYSTAGMMWDCNGVTRVENNATNLNVANAGGYIWQLYSQTGDQLQSGWLLARGATLLDDENVYVPTAGEPWTNALGGGGAVATVANFHTTQLFSNNTVGTCRQTPLALTLGDAPRKFARFLTVEILATRKAIGWTDANAGGAAGQPYTNNAVLWFFDPAVSANWLVRSVRAGAVTDTDTTIAADANAHDIDIISTAAGVVTGYLDGTLRATVAAANNPVATTVLRDIEFAANTGAAVASNLQVCRNVTVMSKRTGATL